LATDFFGGLIGAEDIDTHSIHILLEHSSRENIRSEVAVAALRATEGHGDVDTKGHSLIIPLLETVWRRISNRVPIRRARIFRVLIRRMKPKLAYFIATFLVVTCLAQTLVERTFVMRAETTTMDPYTGTTRTCVLVYLDGKYRMERTFRGMTGSSSDTDTKVYLDTLPEADLKALEAVLDDGKFVAIKTGELSQDKMGKDIDSLLVSVPREHEVQNVAFNNASERKPFEKDLKAFLGFLKNLQKHKAAAAKSEKSNNCEPPKVIYGSTASASKEDSK
jgi:hypothetical protein